MNVSIKGKFVSRWCAMAVIALSIFSCQEMNKWDDPSGNQVFPQIEKRGNYTFEKDIDPAIMELLTYPNGQKPTREKDSELGNVLHMDGGYVKIDNPLIGAKMQNGVSFTFWMKQIVAEGQQQDLTGALLSLQNENGTQKMFLTANGWLSYETPDGKHEGNNPSTITTNIISANQWHYVAAVIRNDGYVIYVDGAEQINTKVPDFDFSKMVQTIASMPNLYIGYGSSSQTGEWLLDDLTVYRNQIAESQIKVPEVGGGSVNSNFSIVGNEDFSSTWWSAFSDFVPMSGNKTTHFGFYNYTDGVNNHNNWVLILTNGKNRGETDYAEYFALRADAYGWGANYNGNNISHNFNLSDGSFTQNMKGAYVDLSIKRTNERVDVKAVITATNGTVYNYTFFYEGITSTDVGAFLTCEKAYLAIDPETVYVGDSYAANTYLVGPADYSGGFWSYFSDFTKITGNTTSPFVYTFYNHTNGINNWNNWVLVMTNGKNRDEAGYVEYCVLRADAYGWGANYNGSNILHNFNFSDGSFTEQMKGAYCQLIITRSGGRFDIKVQTTTVDGVKLGNYTFFCEGITTADIGSFLTIDGCSLDIRTVGYYPLLNTKK